MMAKLIFFIIFTSSTLYAEGPDKKAILKIRDQILELAKEFKGKADPNFKLQDQLDLLVPKLLKLAPQRPVKERLPLIHGAWEQVWGPYDYGEGDRGINKELGLNEIYQVVFPGGYYYNVSPLYKNGDRKKEKISLLRGEYQTVPGEPDMIMVKFTRNPGVRPRPKDKELWELPALAERGVLENEITVFPGFILRWFVDANTLREVYTDELIRIAYSVPSDRSKRGAIYILRRLVDIAK